MSEFVQGEGEAKKSFWSGLPDVPGYMEQKLPSMDRSLDAYLDRNFEAIIEEWGLLREDDLIELERRLNGITEDINSLSARKTTIGERAGRLDILVATLEGRRLK